MLRSDCRRVLRCFGVAVGILATVAYGGAGTAAAQGQSNAPSYQVDPSWPKTLPNNWLIGQVGGIAVDGEDNIWILQRARSLTNDEAWATEAIAYRCDDGTIYDVLTACPDLSAPVPIDGLGNPRPDGPEADCCIPAPAVMQFDADGNLLQAWGGPSDPGFVGESDGVVDPAAACDPDAGCQWPAGEHGIYVDGDGFVYIAGNGTGNGTCSGDPCPWASDHGADSMVLKFASDGTFIYQIGDPGFAGPDSNDTGGKPQPFRPADMEVDPATNELYIADGYGNHRVLVVDAATGEYRRHWGAYGQKPVNDAGENSDEIGPDPNFKNPVHCVRIVDQYVYVCDRVNNRIQVFDKQVAGEQNCANPGKLPGVCGFVDETFVAIETLGNGSTWDLDTSSDRNRSCLFNPDGTNQKVWILERSTLSILDDFGSGGRSAGQFHWVHNLATDSKGNLYTAEVDTGKRAQKFVPQGRKSCRL